jgi:hypothetical protein
MHDEKIYAAVRDLSLAHLLLIHHECMIRGDFDINGKGTPELSQAARTATAALERLKSILLEYAASVYPDKNFLDISLDNYAGVWPPRITGEGRNEE